MGFLHDFRRFTDVDYMMATTAQQAIIDEIQALRQDLHNAGGPLTSDLAYALLQLCERLERSNF